jgi:DNA-binding Xre family transcriptional regulator
MAVSYKKLWKLLIDKDMKKSDLECQSGITHYALGQLTRGKDVSTEPGSYHVITCFIADKHG